MIGADVLGANEINDFTMDLDLESNDHASSLMGTMLHYLVLSPIQHDG